MEKLLKLREQFTQLGLDAMLITNAQNRRYLTGFTGSAGVVLVTKEIAILLVDFRYVEQARTQVQNYEIILLPRKEPIFIEVADQVKNLGISKLGFEEDNLTYSLFKNYQKNLRVEMVPTSGVIEAYRMIKTEDEIAKIKIAAEMADAAFTHTLGFIRPGITEVEIANELEFYMRKQGATSSSFDTIIASGLRSALPHGVASSKVIEKGDMVTLDFGAYYEGYRSDITRTIAIGEPKEELKKIYQIVLGALQKGLDGIKTGMTGWEADALPREFITENGYGQYFGHGTGHGIGLDIHEEPFMSTKCDKIIKPGMVLTVEPGIYIPNLGGVRIEDDILITKEGNEILTKSPRELITL